MSVYQYTNVAKPSRSLFHLRDDNKFNCDMGQLIPCYCDFMMPGDTFTVGNEIVVRTTPLVAPLFAEIKAYVHYFFVPYRILMDTENGFSEFITGFNANSEPVEVELPRWQPTNNQLFSLWDYFGFPIGVTPNGKLPLDFPRRAYNFIYNEFYRDENLIDEVEWTNEDVLYRAWHKDRFTSALPWQQKGISPSLPLSGFAPVSWKNINFDAPGMGYSWESGVNGKFVVYDLGSNQPINGNYKKWSIGGLDTHVSDLGIAVHKAPDSEYYEGLGLASMLGGNSYSTTSFLKGRADLSEAATFNVSDLRLAFQIQRWMEKNARGGTRYTEFLMSHFGVSPKDSRLQRPQYLGGTKSSVMVSEVAQTSASEDNSTPLGNLAGKGITATANRGCKYTAQEFGLIMGIFSIMPRASYQQGIDRVWLYDSKYDFPFPTFAHLSEQPVYNAEIYATNDESQNNGVFGYQPIYQELRQKQGKVCGSMRDTYDYWHLGRKFDNLPVLNKEFIECKPSKRIFAVQNEPGFIINMATHIRAVRPIPKFGNPGLIDHN